VVPPRPEQGDRYAQYNLAIMLLKGQGTQQDAEEALYWCSAAAEQGSAKAQLQMGDLYQIRRGVGGLWRWPTPGTRNLYRRTTSERRRGSMHRAMLKPGAEG
jgi:TPR repeat protein